MFDGNDHIILIVGYTFDRWSYVTATPDQGDAVTIIGNPGDMTQQLRRGYVAGRLAVRGGLATTYDLRVFPGDSGSGVFDRLGRVSGVVSFIYKLDGRAGQLTMAGGWPLAFTAAQWREARSQN